MTPLRAGCLAAAMTAASWCQTPAAIRFPQNPLITVETSKSLGDNVNGPSLIRVPAWVRRPLGKYYLYFAHHKGAHIRLAYSDSLHGPWKIHEPGVLNVRDTAFYREQPDPPKSPPFVYTHVASPEIYVDEARRQIVLYVHGMWTEGKTWPTDPDAASRWLRENGYAQYTQTAVSQDGLHFEARPGISARTSYLRVFPWRGAYYSMARLGALGMSRNPLQPFEPGPSPFDGGPYAGRVRHVALLVRGSTLHVFFSAIGDAPEKILLSSVSLTPDWKGWKASAPREVLVPRESYECTDLPSVPSKAGESEGRERALRDPAVFEENGKVYLFFTVCGEQGIGAAEVTSLLR